VRSGAATVPLLALSGLLLASLYPALVLDARLAPEASLKSVAPWRQQSGPYPQQPPLALEAATHLGPRLAAIARDRFAVSLWDPWIGGGRPGWLAAPEEGGAPLALIAGLLARPGWAWTGLVALEIAVGFLVVWWFARRLGMGPWSASVAGLAYTLSGAAVVHWLDWQGSAIALGPLAFLAAASSYRGRTRTAAAWGATLVLLLLAGRPALPFVAGAACLAALSRPVLERRNVRWAGVALGLLLAVAAILPARWLQSAGAEPGAAPQEASDPGPPPSGWRAFIIPVHTDALSSEDAAATLVARTAAFLGGVVVLLALAGVVAAPARQRAFWLVLGGFSVWAVMGPARMLDGLPFGQRPYAMLALVASIFAGFGAEAIWRRLSPRLLADALVATLCGLVGWSLGAPAARFLPFESRADARLPSPVPSRADALDARFGALLDTLPPDVGATLGLADVRATSFPAEPRYAALLGAESSGELSISRALSRRSARLGLRWLLEPVSLHVVSGEIFARTDPGDLIPADGGPPVGLLRFHAEVPVGATRVALPSRTAPSAVWIERAGSRAKLEPDPALAAESAAWSWFALPTDWPAGLETIVVRSSRLAPRRTMITWDTSGLLLRGEEGGVRLWEREHAAPFAFLATSLEAEGAPPGDDGRACTVPPDRLAPLRAVVATPDTGKVVIDSLSPTTARLAVTAAKPGLLVVEIKHRPRLWRAEVNHIAARCERANGVWTGIVVPAGGSQVVLRARIPAGLWVVSAGALVALAALALWRRAG
jgi:hypothetical protein